MSANATAFACRCCGLCCQHVDRNPMTTYLNRGDGQCLHFDSISRLCSIYAERPLFCRVEESYPAFAKTMSREAYVELNRIACEALAREHITD